MAIIGVMGSGSAEWPKLAVPLGIWIAQNGYDLLTGADQGVMLSVSRVFYKTSDRFGRSIGIVPTQSNSMSGFIPLDGYPNPFIEIPIFTPLPRKADGTPEGILNRNYVNVLTSDIQAN